MKYTQFLLLLLAVSVLVSGCSKTQETQADPFEAMPSGTAETRSEAVEYSGYSGWYAEPATEGEYPGIVLIHEWWGLNENMKRTAERIATHGYRVIAVDLYNGQVATSSDEARALTQSLNQEEADANLAAAANYLRSENSAKVGTWGYCFGGGQSARFATVGNTDATVIYYGNLAAPLEVPEAVNAPVFMVYGEADTATPSAAAEELAGKLTEQGIAVDVALYPKLGHAFANPSNSGHDPEATKDAWDRTLTFLAENLQ